jgi:glucokinase
MLLMKKTNSPSNPLAIGIEIGGTKIQVGVGSISGKLLTRGIVRKQVIWENGAAGIRRDLVSMTEELLESKHLKLSNIDQIGIGFGGILDTKQGIVLKSFQIEGWDNFPLREWAEKQWRRPISIQNDASTAGLAESLRGNGRGYSRIFYMTIGSGVGGGWILNGKIDDGQGFGAAEIGHIWVPDPKSGMPTELEQICSGWAIGRRARLAALSKKTLMTKIAGTAERIDTQTVYSAAEKGDKIANLILDETGQILGLAISNVIALLHPERVILGGGVSLMGSLFWNRLRKEVQSRTIPLFASQVDVVRAKLKEDVVVIGALCLE